MFDCTSGTLLRLYQQAKIWVFFEKNRKRGRYEKEDCNDILGCCVLLTLCGRALNSPEKQETEEQAQEVHNEQQDTQEVQETVVEEQQPEQEQTKEQKDGFSSETNSSLEIGGYTFSIPSYFGEMDEGEEGKSARYYAEQGDQVVMLYFYCEEPDITQEEFLSDKYQEDFQSGLTNQIEDVEILENSETTISDCQGRIFSYKGVFSGIPATHKCIYFYNSGSGKLIVSSLLETPDAQYDYTVDFVKIALSATPVANDAEPEADDMDGVSEDFKAWMDAYEAFFDEYIEFMETYQNSDNPASLMTEYAEYMTKYTEAMEALDNINEEELSDAEYAYYLEVMNRVNQKLLQLLN